MLKFMIEHQYDTPGKAMPGRKLPTLGPLLILIGWLALLLAGTPAYQRQPVEWVDTEGQTLRGTLWLPRPAPAGSPGVILVHGVMASQAQTEPTARSLATAGLAVLSFDLRGYGDSDAAPDTPEVHRDDVLSALTFLRGQAGIDAHRIALIGHSMGASAVVAAAAEDGRIRLVRAMGMHGEGRAEWVTGLYDALHPPGVFNRAVISPAANHHIEWQDLWLEANHQRRLEQVFGLPPAPLPWQEWLRHAATLAIGWGFLALLASLWRDSRRYVRLLGLSAGIGLLVLCGSFGWLDAGLCAGAALLLLAAAGLSQLPLPLLKRTGWLLGGLFLARETVSLLRGLPWILPEPARLSWFPLYLLQSLSYYPQALLHGLQALLLPVHHGRLEAGWLLGALLLSEWLYPGWWLGLGARLRRPEQRRRANGVALLIGMALLLGVLGLRLQQGYLSGAAVEPIARVLSTDVLPTLGLFGAGWWWRQSRTQCPRDDSNIRPTV